MRLLPRSLAGRLLATAAIAIVLALVAASLVIGHVLGRFVMEGLDQRLDAQLAVTERAVRPDGSLDRTRMADVPPFDEPGSGWAWQVTAPGGTLRSASLQGTRLTTGPLRPARYRDALRPRPFEAEAPDGEPVHGRMALVPTAAGPAEVVATAPRWIVERPLRAAIVPLLLSVALLGAALALAVFVQLRLGLRPLARLQAMLAEVRGGRRRRVEVDEPSELLPLVAELNALIDANEAGLTRARLHVANLAHGLKTPLATLRLDLDAPGRDPDGRLRTQVARLEDQVRHHLGRARAAEGAMPHAPTVPLAPAIEGLVAALDRLYAERGIVASRSIDADLAVRCDAQDLDELLGNLLDNAWRFARSRIDITATAAGATVAITIGNDGDVLDNYALAALRDGTIRADERGDGHGQGVRIARELIELHGGDLSFARSAPDGTMARITLPATL